MIRLDKRLEAAASLVAAGRPVADIGTDHAFLPAYLVMTGKSPCALACDIGAKPLANARATMEHYALADKIRLLISDGLQSVPPEAAREIVIAGMGGTLIARILAACGWVKDPDCHLILQPMSSAEDIREYLCNDGYFIDRETAVMDENRLYIFLSARYSGEKKAYPSYYPWFGESRACPLPEAAEYVRRQTKRLKDACRARAAAGLQDGETKRLQAMLADLIRDNLTDSEE